MDQQPPAPTAAPDDVAEVPACSSKGCRAAATWALRWNNPRLHTPERRKVWLACEDHRSTLHDFLASRGFWRETVPFDPDDAEGLAV